MANIFAIGDIKGGPAFTHISYDDFRIVKANVLEKGNASIKDRLLPYTVFIDPQLGRVGMTEGGGARDGAKNSRGEDADDERGAGAGDR